MNDRFEDVFPSLGLETGSGLVLSRPSAPNLAIVPKIVSDP